MAIRYVYKPYHSWRHGYRREKRRKWLLLAARILLVLECLWFSYHYIKAHTFERTMVTGPQIEEAGEELYGFGFGPGEKKLFWFHSYPEPETGEEPQNSPAGG